MEEIRWGSGPPVLLVHGSLADGPSSWSRQRPLAERFELRVMQRRGFGASPDAEGEDFLVDADDLCALLAGEPSHVVAHSYGAIGALIAAARVPSCVRSLTLIEPTAVSAAAEDPDLARGIAFIAEWWRTAPEDPAEFLPAYGGLLGIRVPEAGGSASDPVRRAAVLLRHCRRPWTAEPAWEQIAAAGIPSLVVSGGGSPALATVADRVAERIGGSHRRLDGAGHAAQRDAERFNPLLEEHLDAAS